jgi:serine/threonine-protein kinase
MVDDADDVNATDTAMGETLPVPGTVMGHGSGRPSATSLDSGSATPPVRARRAHGYTLPRILDAAHRYTLGDVLGRGGMGEVLGATDEQIGRDVAVKRMRSTEPSADEVARFVREARVQGQLEHPAVVPVHDLAVDGDGRPFFVMKRLSGKPMSALLDDQRAARGVDVEKRLLRAFADICLAVEFAHDNGIIHRDLKPANVMLGDFGEVYVLDWGIARTIADRDAPGAAAAVALQLDTGETRAGTVLGTPAYMAPEQLAGDRAGPAADIYALGCILYEIVAGEPLHAGARSLAAAASARPSAHRADAPPEFDAICEKATAFDPAARHASARELHRAVQAYLDGDRDVAARRQLAREHVDRARAALASAGEDGRHRARCRPRSPRGSRSRTPTPRAHRAGSPRCPCSDTSRSSRCSSGPASRTARSSPWSR